MQRTCRRTTTFHLAWMLPAALALAACEQVGEPAEAEDVAAAAVLYQAAPVQRRNITVAVEAAGVVEPVVTVEVKSKASGEILSLPVDTGDHVQSGTLLARIDRRVLDNELRTAKANLEVARARLANAESSLERTSQLYHQESLSKSDFEQATLNHAIASSEVVRGGIQVENATIQLDDSDALSPITGTVIERLVEEGQVISSPMGDVGGGTLLLKMADLSRVQVRMLVDEIDIGKVQPGVVATVNVAAYANRPFQGEVLKVEPQALVQQNVTMFPVLIDIDNRDGLLKPGMNAEVEVLIARRDDALTIPAAALRTEDDIHAAGSVLGLDYETVQNMIAEAPTPPAQRGRGAGRGEGAGPPAAAAGGVDRQRMRAIFGKLRAGETLTEEERKLAEQMRSRMAAGGGPPGAFRGGGGARRNSGVEAQFGGDYLVFAMRGDSPVALRVRTGITDLDHTEVVFGLDEGDEVLILPSASLIRAQESFQARMSRRMGIPGLSRDSGSGSRGGASSGSRSRSGGGGGGGRGG